MPPALQAMTVALLALAVVLLLVVLLRLPRPDGTAGLVQQQLVELRNRLDGLVAAQRALPATLAEGAREQLGVLGDVRDRLGALQATTRQLERLGQSVGEVERLLQVPKLRGTIGERWLEQLLADVMPSGSFELQYAFRSGERVDAVVRVGDRLVPVDAKFPLEACRRMVLAGSEEERERERRAFLRSVRARVDEIAERYLRPDENTFEFALMYIPAESVYYEAVVRDAGTDGEQGVLEYALARKVVPVSPHTFYAYLLVVLHGLRGLEVEARAREILDGLGALRQQFDAFWTAHDKVGTHLANAARQYEESMRLRGRVEDGFARLGSAPPEGRSGT
jgi:DNA recombination protein RmuC